jgi:hypothetical protein
VGFAGTRHFVLDGDGVDVFRAARGEDLARTGAGDAHRGPAGRGALLDVDEHAGAVQPQQLDVLFAGDHEALERERRADPVAVEAIDVHPFFKQTHQHLPFFDRHPRTPPCALWNLPRVPPDHRQGRLDKALT